MNKFYNNAVIGTYNQWTENWCIFICKAHYKREEEKFPYAIKPPKFCYLEIILPKEVKDLLSKKFKISVK